MKSKILNLTFIIWALVYVSTSCNPLANPGKDLYVKHCQNCHGYNGEGLQHLIPPLANADFIKNNQAILACIIKYGTSQKMRVNGVWYEEKMPSNIFLTDVEITNLINFINTNFGNSIPKQNLKQVVLSLENCKKE